MHLIGKACTLRPRRTAYWCTYLQLPWQQQLAPPAAQRKQPPAHDESVPWKHDQCRVSSQICLRDSQSAGTNETMSEGMAHVAILWLAYTTGIDNVGEMYCSICQRTSRLRADVSLVVPAGRPLRMTAHACRSFLRACQIVIRISSGAHVFLRK